MKIIISPAKKMNVKTDDFPAEGLPVYIDKTKLLLETIQSMTLSQLQSLWKCNDKLARLNFERYRKMDLEGNLTPAVLSYEGLQYQHMAPVVFTDHAVEYIQKHLRILSGFYGILRPFDGVAPYRMEMQAPLRMGECKDLYQFWGSGLYEQLKDDDHTIINLASKEYSKAVEKYLTAEDRYITIVFGEEQKGKVRQKGTFAKMARGEMVRFMAENEVTDPEDIKKFNVSGYRFSEKYSTDCSWTFLM